MINPQAVERYLNEPVDCLTSIKDWSPVEVDEVINELSPPPKFVLQPYDYQKRLFILGMTYPAVLFEVDMGLGKSKLSIDIAQYRKLHGQVNRTLIFVPFAGNVETWRREVAKHAPDASFIGFQEQSREEKIEGLLGDSNFVCMTYQAFLGLMSDRKDKDDGGGWVLNEKRLDWVGQLFQMFVADESSALRNHTSLTYKSINKLTARVPYRYLLTGTPMNQDPSELWPQYKIVDQGYALGSTLGMFRQAFCKEVQGWGGYPEYKFDESKREIFQKKLAHRRIRYEKTECHDLPEKVRVIKPVIFSEELWKYYDKLITELREAKGNFQLMENAFVRMRMLCSGYLACKDPTGERVEVVFKTNPKLDALQDFIENLGDKKLIIFHEYVKTGELISTRLKTLKRKHVRLYSDVRDKVEVVRRFMDDPATQILVSTSSGAFGHNFQMAHNMAFLETPTQPILRAQEEDRIHRIGQTETCFYYDFVVKASIEEKILKSLNSKRDFLQDILSDVNVLDLPN